MTNQSKVIALQDVKESIVKGSINPDRTA